MSVLDLITLGRDITVSGLLLLAVWGSFKGWWVPGWIYRQSREDNFVLREERDVARRELLDTLGLVSRSVHVAEKVVDRTQRGDRLALEREVRSQRIIPTEPHDDR